MTVSKKEYSKSSFAYRFVFYRIEMIKKVIMILYFEDMNNRAITRSWDAKQ